LTERALPCLLCWRFTASRLVNALVRYAGAVPDLDVQLVQAVHVRRIQFSRHETHSPLDTAPACLWTRPQAWDARLGLDAFVPLWVPHVTVRETDVDLMASTVVAHSSRQIPVRLAIQARRLFDEARRAYLVKYKSRVQVSIMSS
jgi:hypothetical protein